MILEDWHTHNSLCGHAQGKIEDYIKSALNMNLSTLGISDHFPYEFYNNFENIPYEEYSMSLEEIKLYLSTIKELKDKYKNRINVKISFEIDFIVNQVDILNTHLKKIKDKLDYILGSLHVLFSERGPWCFDDSRFSSEFNNYESINAVYLHYYDTQIEMIEHSSFDYDIVSHLDLPKKFGKVPETMAILQDKIWKVLEKIKNRDLVIEINTSGLRKDIKEQYPSMDIIRKMYELDIPILLGSDAHKPEEIAYKFDYMIDKLKDIGYTQFAHFENRKRSFIDIN